MSGSGKTSLPLLVAVLALLAFILVYMNLFTPAKDRISSLKSENESLETEIADLKEKVSYQGYYETESDRMRMAVRTIFGLFPADVKIEDAIVTAIDLEGSAPAVIPNVGFTPSVDVYSVGDGGAGETAQEESAPEETSIEEDVETAAEGGATTYSDSSVPKPETITLESGYQGPYGSITLRNAVMTLNFQTSYSGMKNLLQYFAASADRSSISQINLAYDTTTGLLNGSATVNRYSLTGTNRQYTPPAFPVNEIGTSNIFGTVELTGGRYNVDMGGYGMNMGGTPSMDTGEPLMGEEFPDTEGEELMPEEGTGEETAP